MAKEDTERLLAMLEVFAPPVRETTVWLRERIWDMFPECNELIYDNYNALAIGWGFTDKLGDVFCSLAVYSHVNLGFNRGTELADPAGLLQGKGNIYRYLTLKDAELLNSKPVQQLLHEAYTHALTRLKSTKHITGQTIVKSVSVKKRRPGRQI
jgi:hypothetical protein